MNSIWTLASMNLISGRVKEGSRWGSPERRRLWAKIGVRVFVACLCILALSPASQAADCLCRFAGTPSARGKCLIQMIIQANLAKCTGNTITLERGPYELFEAEVHNSDGVTGLPSITRSLLIVGAGSGILPGGPSTIIRRAPNSLDVFRIFHVADGVTLSLSGLKIQEGYAQGNSTDNTGRGGGIFVQEQAGLILNDVDLTENSADGDGGGIFLAPPSDPTDRGVSVNGSRLSQNTAKGTAVRDSNGVLVPAQASGGGISATGFRSLSILDSVIERSLARTDGGGIAADFLDISNDSTVRGSVAMMGNGGGIVVGLRTLLSEATIRSSTFSGNTAALSGGGIAAHKLSVLEHSMIIGNSALDEQGGGINTATLDISKDSTVERNSDPMCLNIAADTPDICR
jgi:predicted outer membrane repeat protein